MQVTPSVANYDKANHQKASTSDTNKQTASEAKKQPAPQRLTDQLYARFSENEVNLSQKSKKLSAINQKFFSGVIKSEDLPMLKQRLFEEGFISDKDYSAMGGKPDKVRAVKQAIDFVRGYSETLKTKDAEAFKGMQTVLTALQNISSQPSSANRKLEQSAIQFLQAHAKELKNTQADSGIQESVNKVLGQLIANQSNQSKRSLTGGVDQYASIQNTQS